MNKTVNIIEIVNNNLNAVFAFKDNEKGNKKADELALALLKENANYLSNEDMQFIIDEGYFEDNNGYQLYIAHSINTI